MARTSWHWFSAAPGEARWPTSGLPTAASEMQLAPLVVCEAHTIWRVLARKSSPADAVLLFSSSKQTGADEQVEDMVAFCHGTFVAVDFRRGLKRRRGWRRTQERNIPVSTRGENIGRHKRATHSRG